VRDVPLSLKIFTAQIGVDSTTVWRWRRDGILKTVNINGKLFILPSDLAEFNRRVASGEFSKEIAPPSAPRLHVLQPA
jgi:hypothetical protein